MNIIFRVDASQWIGSGHVMRCLVLADALKKNAHLIRFACLPQCGDLITHIERKGYQVIKLTPVESPTPPTSDSDYPGWLQKTIAEDADDFINKIGFLDVVITDHYSIGLEWQKKIKTALACKVIAIDDLVRHHDADCIIDQSLGRTEKEYSSKGLVLAGVEFALLDKRFVRYRSKISYKAALGTNPKILISMGGIDAPNATCRAIKSLQGLVHAEFTVLLGPLGPHYQEVVTLCNKFTNVTHFSFHDNMAELMSEHDIAIGGAGGTSWERACLGLPSIIVVLADNQKNIADQLVKKGAAIAVDLKNIESDLLPSLEKLMINWCDFRKKSFNLLDGNGTQRVVLKIQQKVLQVPIIACELTLASLDDIKLVYDWQSHPQTRKYSINKDIPSWVEHSKWMSKKLSSAKDFFYIIKKQLNNDPVGVIRLDNLDGNTYLVSIFVSPEKYGNGIAFEALTLIDIVHPNFEIHAVVLEDNLPSQKLFEKANYVRISAEKFIRSSLTGIT